MSKKQIISGIVSYLPILRAIMGNMPKTWAIPKALELLPNSWANNAKPCLIFRQSPA